MPRQYHIACDDGDVAPSVLLPGDPGRVPLVAALWDDARDVAWNREYRTMTGTYRGLPISCTSTGIGGPSTAIAMEELARLGARVFLRIGTCGSFQDHVAVGDLVVFDAAVRVDGTSHHYAPAPFPAAADHRVVAAAVTAAEALGERYHVGLTRSSDAFYAGHPAPGSSFGGYWHSSWRDQFDDFRRLGVLAAEMEAATIFVLARLWGLAAGGVALVGDNVFDATDATGHFDPEAQFALDVAGIERLARLGCETLRVLHEAGPAPGP